MRKSFILFAFLTFHQFAFCQSSSHAGQVAANFYYYSQFISGKVFFKTGKTTEARLNYNLALEEIHFINTKGDTLALANEGTLQVVIIGSDSFYYDKGYLKIVETYNNLKLASKQKRSSESQKQRGAYGENVSGSAAININNYTPADKASIKLNPNEGTYGTFEISYFIMDANNNVVPATKKNFLKYFPKFKPEIETFINSNALDLSVENDLKKLFLYANSLNNS